MPDKLAASVASILSSSRIALNVGIAAGVAEGDPVFVMRTEHITDPDTKEELGSVDLVHLRFRVTQVDQRFCIAEVIELAEGEQEPGINFLPRVLQPARRKRVADDTGTSRKDPDIVPVYNGQAAVVMVKNPE